MDPILAVDPAAVAAQAPHFTRAAQDVHQVLARIQTTYATLGPCWGTTLGGIHARGGTDETSKALEETFTPQYSQLVQGTSGAAAMLDQIAAALLTAAANYQHAETTGQHSFG